MPDTSQTSHRHRTRSASRSGSSSRHSRTGYLEPVYYFSGVIVLLILVKILHGGLLSPATGAFGIILMAVSKQWRFKPGVILSVICMFTMVMVFVWQWVDYYFLTLLSGEMALKPLIFLSGLTDSLTLLILLWIFQRLLNSIHMRMSQKWFVKKSYVTVFRLLLYFQLFLLFFWIIAFVVLKAQPFTHLTPQDSTMIAGALALLAAGIPAIIYISKSSPGSTGKRHHRHHHRHDRNGLLKNSEVGEN
jgi:hypothetical protein